ncbi:MAG: PIN domain-containing protein [Acidobacteria bacterium]|nr:PIN domain-containing protein [Acidobacteriota bacterium]
MTAFALDTNCLIAAVCTWHDRHRQAAAEIGRRLDAGERLVVPAPALVEAYAVLTRLPAPHRLAPGDAWTLLESNFVKPAHSVQIWAPSAKTYPRLLRGLAAQSVAGGRAYDAVIGECAREAAAQTLLTFNRRHFDPSPAGVTVVEPSSTSPAVDRWRLPPV